MPEPAFQRRINVVLTLWINIAKVGTTLSQRCLNVASTLAKVITKLIRVLVIILNKTSLTLKVDLIS